jgi:hypothetical protein
MARIALLTDIHANREAFEACLADAERRGADRLVILGDLVGYGADPAWVVAKAKDLAAAGTIILKGNHDEAAVLDRGGMNSDAAAAAAWTRGVLDDADKAFLRALPLEAEEEDRLYVHADATDPAAWHYVTDADGARRSMSGDRCAGRALRPCARPGALQPDGPQPSSCPSPGDRRGGAADPPASLARRARRRRPAA